MIEMYEYTETKATPLTVALSMVIAFRRVFPGQLQVLSDECPNLDLGAVSMHSFNGCNHAVELLAFRGLGPSQQEGRLRVFAHRMPGGDIREILGKAESAESSIRLAA